MASLAGMAHVPRDRKHRALVLASLDRQARGAPVHAWDLATESEASDWASSYRTIGQFMTTDLFTVRPWDQVDLAACLMDWEHIRHVPVEDDAGRLAGLVSHRSILRLVAQGATKTGPVGIAAIMKTDPVTASPETTTLDAIALMRRHHIGCLPVVSGGKLVGIVTEHDFLMVASSVLAEQLAAVQDPRPVPVEAGVDAPKEEQQEA
jgi:CBS domain-containing protein